MKKLTALLLSVLMLTGLFGAALADGGDNTLTVWCWDPNFNIYAMEQAEKAYQEEHPDFKLNIVETPWDDLQTKLITGAAGDITTLPDIFLMQDNAFQKNVITYPEIFVDLTNSGVNFADFGAAKVAYSVVDGKNYGVPFDSGCAIAVYRTDVLEKAGYTLKDMTDIDWDRYLEIGKDVLDKTGMPLLTYRADEVDFAMMILQSMGASLFDKEGKVTMKDNEAVKLTCKIYLDLLKAGVLTQVPSWDEYIKAIVADGCASTINGCWILGSVQAAEDLAGKWGVTNMPKVPGVEGATNYSNNGGSSWAVSANCKNTELAFDFLNKTFGSNVTFYENILEKAGALATYLPAGESDIYAKPQPFFADQKIYQDIVAFSGHIPQNNTGVYYYEARNALSVAIQEMAAGADMQQALDNAQQEVEFAMGM